MGCRQVVRGAKHGRFQDGLQPTSAIVLLRDVRVERAGELGWRLQGPLRCTSLLVYNGEVSWGVDLLTAIFEVRQNTDGLVVGCRSAKISSLQIGRQG